MACIANIHLVAKSQKPKAKSQKLTKPNTTQHVNHGSCEDRLCVIIYYVIHNISVFFQVMAWCQRGDKPLPEPMLNIISDIMESQGAHKES